MNTKIDKNALALKIKSLEGLSADEKSALLGLLNSRKKYGLIWEEKEEAVEELLRDKLPVLTEVKEKRIIAENTDSAPDHILIEGDNLHALLALQYTHAGKVDVIEIDPPYNTGNKDFVYNDSFVDKEDAWRHSKWLCFISKRLRLAKVLLKESGVVFIHIDDNEQAQLKLLCDEIFGEENFNGQILWKKKTNGNNVGIIPPVHDFITSYSKNITECKIDGLPLSQEYLDKSYSNPDNDIRGPWTTSDLSANHVGPHFPITNPKTGTIHQPPKGRYWVFNETEVLRRIGDGRIIFGKSGTGKPIQKKFLHEKTNTRKKAESWWDKNGLNSDGTSELGDLVGTKAFIHPKPVRLVKDLISIVANSNLIILDFFAGSGTTLHATMALNAEDNGSRRCILVTNNENNICEEVTYERNKRVIQGYTKQNGEPIPGLTNNNLRYYKTDFIDREPSMKNRKALTRAAVDLLCIRENCYTPYSQYDAKEIRVFTGKECELIIIFDPADIDTAIAIIDKLYPGKKKRGDKPRCKVYVFSPGHYAYDEEFEPVINKIELCALPEAIYRAYKAVLPKAKLKFLDEVEQEGAAS